MPIELIGFLVSLPFVTALVLKTHYYWNVAPAALTAWANREGLLILRAERRFFRLGPFFWTSSGQQSVFRVFIHDVNARCRTGWVRIGGFWRFSTEAIEARWDPPQPPVPVEAHATSAGCSPLWDRELDG